MGSGVDTSKWKPRRTRGTPTYRFRSYFSLAVLGVAAVAGFIWTVLPGTENLRNYSKEAYSNRSEEVKERQLFMSLIPQKRGDDILKIIEEHKDLMKER